MVINDEDGKQAALLVSRSAAVTGQKHNVVGSSPDTSVRVDFVKVQAVLLLGSPSEDYQSRMSEIPTSGIKESTLRGSEPTYQIPVFLGWCILAEACL